MTAVAHRDHPGLSAAEAAARLAAEGANELPSPDRRTPLRIAIEVLREPMLALLLCGGVIYMALGDIQEAIILLVFAMLSIGITIVQETRTERVLEALRDLSSPRALVIRDGQRRRIAGREVVRGDAVVLAEGDRVPADAILRRGSDLQCDESLLTGESVPVRKLAAVGPEASAGRPGGDDLPGVFAGSLVVRGSGVAEVTATGPRSEIGKIGQSLRSIDTEPPRLRKQTRDVVRIAAIGGALVSVIAMVLYGLLRGGWLQALLNGITIGMSMLPEEIPVVLTVFMAMGAWRISRARVLTRRASAIESLGSATVLCTDKTGTLTENRMTIAELRVGGRRLRAGDEDGWDGDFAELLTHGRLASAPRPFDPMDVAFHAYVPAAEEAGSEPLGVLVRAYGLRPDLLAVTNVWGADEGAPEDADELTVAAKGAPEAIFTLCGLAAAEVAGLRAQVDEMAAAGLRVLGVAKAAAGGAPLPDSQRDFSFFFLGLVGLADPLRAGVTAAVRECRSAGIRVVMITGDYPATAEAIAQQAGVQVGATMTGDELANLDDAGLRAAVREISVFARIMPEQKLRIVNALKANGEIVAMTGDGVNDAPSLKAAHIGIAMGGRGTDVAREASAIVLLDDDFTSIVAAVRLGRRIYDNIRKAMGFIIAVHVPIAGLALLPLVLGLPIIFSPIHIAFLEMVIDPVCSIAFEAEREERDLMMRPPRSPEASVLNRALLAWSLLQGVLAFALVGGIFVLATWRGMAEPDVRALAFSALVLVIFGLILVNRTYSASLRSAVTRRNGVLGLISAIVFGVLAASLAVPAARTLFKFGPLHPSDLAIVLATGAVFVLVLELLKPIWRSLSAS